MGIALNRLALAVTALGLATLYGCGGGSSGGTTAAVSSQITGTAATGAALANAPVAITNSSGTSPCSESSITTSASGSYTCTLKAGESAPFFIVVTDPAGAKPAMVSVATQTPVAGTPQTVNVTPLTTAIVAQLNNGDAMGVVTRGTVDPTALANATTNIVQQLAPALTAIGVASGYSPFSTSIAAATAANTGNSADQVLDVVKVGVDPATGKLALSTITDPTPVLLATATTTGTQVAAPSVNASDLGQATTIAAQAFTNCFALSTAQRVLGVDTTITAANGGPSVTSVAAACQNLAANGTNVGLTFMHNGYSAGQFFYGLLTSDTMTGATFSVPEIMAFYPADPASAIPAETYDRAILNIRYLDNAGNPGNVITAAANIPSSSTTTRPTNWWLVGNQQIVDVVANPTIRRVEQLNPAATNKGWFESGIFFKISTVGPNSASLTSAQILGDGLPSTGLWYFKNSASTAPYMDMSNSRVFSATPTVPTLCATSNCPIFYFNLTQGVTGAAASTYAVNPTSLRYAQGSSEGSYNGTSGTRPHKGSVYTVNLYAGSTIAYTVKKVLLADLIDPVAGVNLPWNTLGVQSLAALDPTNAALNGPLASVTIDWVQNPAAQQVATALAKTTNGGSFSNNVAVPKGALSATVTPSPYQITGLSGTPSATNGYRTLQFSYRMLDGSAKLSLFSYN